MREGVFAGAVLVCLTASMAFGADGQVASLLGGGVLAALGAAALLRPCPAPPPAFWVGAGLTVWLAVQAVAARHVFLAGPELAAMVGIAGAFAAGHAAGAETERARRAATVLTAGLLLLAGASFVMHAASPDAVLGRAKPYHAGRLTGPFLSANTAATMMAMAMVWGLAGTLRAVRGAAGAVGAVEALGRQGRLPALLVLIAGTALLLTGSRAGIAVGMVSAGALLAWHARRGFGAKGLVAAGGVCVALVLLSSGGVLQDRLAEAGTDDAGRLVLWRASLAAWQEAPLLGHGLGGFARALAPQVKAETAPVLSVQGAAHDLLLQWLVQTGVVGTLWGGLTLGLVAWHLARGLARRTRGRWVLRGALGALGVALLHGLVDYGLEVPAVAWWLALIVGLASGVASGRTEVTARADRPDRRERRT